jgi:hypothetical protein
MGACAVIASSLLAGAAVLILAALVVSAWLPNPRPCKEDYTIEDDELLTLEHKKEPRDA